MTPTPHLQVGIALQNLMVAYRDANRPSDAERVGLRALSIIEQQKSPRHEHVAALLRTLILVYVGQQKMAEAEPSMGRLISIDEETDRSSLAGDYEAYSEILRGLNRPAQAQEFDTRARRLREQ